MIRPPPRTINLDTSFLIRALVPGSDESSRLRTWLGERRSVAISTFTWGEFLCGPLGESDRKDARRIAQKHVPVGTEEATTAAGLFNRTGRRRGSFPDCIIAATAIVSGSELATSNEGDFVCFRDAGLELAD